MTKSFLFIHFHAKSSLVGQQQPAQHQPLTNKPETREHLELLGENDQLALVQFQRPFERLDLRGALED